MKDILAFTPVDWPLYETLLDTVRDTSLDAAGLAARLKALTYHSDEDAEALVRGGERLNQSGMFTAPEILAGPKLRVDANRYANDIAAWARNQEAEDAAQYLSVAAFVDSGYEMACEHYLFLAWFDEVYRTYAMGIAADEVLEQIRFAGDPMIFKAMGSHLHTDPKGVTMLEPAEVSEIAAALTEVRLGYYPLGDTGSMYDFYEDFIGRSQHLEEFVADEFRLLLAFYRQTANDGYGLAISA